MNKQPIESHIWVTGASSGIGLEVAKELLLTGKRLIVSSRSDTDLIELFKEEISNQKAVPISFDFSVPTEIERVVLENKDLVSKTETIINCAGIGQYSDPLKTLESVDRYLMEVNYWGPRSLINAVFRDSSMLKNIVLVSSVSGWAGLRMRAGYSASKHAIKGYMESLMLSQKEVKIAIVSPGYANTSAGERALTEDGSPVGTQDDKHRNGLDPKYCAEKIIDSVGKNKSIVVGKRTAIRFSIPRLNFLLSKCLPY